MGHKPGSDNVDAMKLRANIVLIIFLVIGAFFLIAQHRAHVIGWSPYSPFLRLLAYPLLHLSMHGGHGHGEHWSTAAVGVAT